MPINGLRGESMGLGIADPGGSEKLNGLNAGLYGGIRLPPGPGEKSKEAGVDTAEIGEEEAIEEPGGGGFKLGPDVTIRMAGGVGRDRSSTGGPVESKSILGHCWASTLSRYFIRFSNSKT